MKFFTTPTGFSAVPPDCLHEIFQYLENDMISLYRCMLVNRIWCRIVIPLLWRCPFEYSEHKSRKYFELIRTYIDCLPKSAKERIRETGCNLPLNTSPLFPYHDYLKELDCQSLNEAVKEWIERSELNRLEDLDDVICETGYNTSPFLPYHDYLRKPDCQKLDKDVEEWTKLNQCPEDSEDPEDPEDPEDLIYAELLKLLLSRRKGLWRLRLGQYGNKYHFPLISEVPCMKYTLSNLRRFEFLGDIDHLSEPGLDNLYEFLVKLSSIANNIEYMDIDTGEDERTLSGIGLQKLILSQKNLLGFRYTQENSKVENSKAFIKTLSSNANTLKNVEFVYLPLNEQCLSPLKKFNNLESMQFLYCYDNDIFGETEEVLEASPSQLKVKKLIFHKGQLSLVTLEILRLANTSVRELTVDNVVPGLFKVISEHCPNIEYLAAAISQKTFESLAYLSTSKVEHLVLKTLDNRDIETKDFQQLGKCLSLSLRHLSLDFNTSVEELSSLLTECQSPLKSLSLKLGITTDDMNRDEYLKVVMEFAKKNESLKELKISLYDISSDKHKKSFNDIEAKDIFTKDILSKAQLLVPNISKETHKPFTCPQAS